MINIKWIAISAAVAALFSGPAGAQLAKDPGNPTLTASAFSGDNKIRTEPGEKVLPVATGNGAIEIARTNYCFTCHDIDSRLVGPAWSEVAEMYRDDAGAEDKLVKKVSSGGNGVWETELAMPGFAEYVNEADIRTLVRYILSLK